MDSGILLRTSLRNLFLSRQESMEVVTKALMGCQAQFANNPKYSMMIRSHDYNEEFWKNDYVKLWSFRGTIHTIHPDQIKLLLSARSRHHMFYEGWDINVEEKPYWSSFIYNQIRQGNVSRSGLKDACQLQGMDESLRDKVFHGWGGLIREMCDHGMIAYENSTSKNFIALEETVFMETDKARIQVIEQYFETFGPATIQDCMYYTAYKQREVKEYMQKIKPYQTYEEDNKTYYYYQSLSLEGPIDKVIILAGFDPLILGYKDKSRFMDDYEKNRYVTNTGIIHPGILLNGRLKAKWRKNSDTNITVTLYKKISKKTKSDIQSKFRKLFSQRRLVVDFIDVENML